MSFISNANFDATSSEYVLPYHSVFVGQGGAPNFQLSGNGKIFVDSAGVPVGAWI